MEIKEYVRKRLKKSAAETKLFWDGVKSRLPNEPFSGTDQLQIVDIQEISDDCVDLVILRKSNDIDCEQLELCRIVAERSWFKKPKISIHFSSGPFAHEFFEEK
jgi:hypothetical protein